MDLPLTGSFVEEENPRLKELQHKHRLLRARRLVGAFCSFVFRWEMQKFQKKWHKHADKFLRALIFAPQEHGKVLYGNILMEDGSIKHCTKLNIGDEVVSLDEKALQTSFSKVEQIEYHKIPTVKVQFASGRECICGEFHQFFTPNGWEEITNLYIGADIAVPRELPFFGNKSIGINIAKTLGLLIAEGGFSNSTITLTNTDIEVIKDFEKYSGFQVKPKSKNVKFGNWHLVPREEIRSFLENFSLLGKLSKEKFVPDEIFTAPQEEVLAFLATYIQGDGSFYFVRSKPQFEVGSASKQLIKDVYHLLLRFGISGRIYHKQTKLKDKVFPSWNIRLYHAQAVNLAKILLPLLVGERYRQAKKVDECIIETFCSSRDLLPKELWKKLQIAKKCWKSGYKFLYHNPNRWSLQQIADATGDPEIKKYAESNIFWDTLKNIKENGTINVPFITFGPHPTFVGEDIYHHNTTQMSLVRPLFKLGHNPNRLWKIISCNDDKAVDILGAITKTIESNSRLHEVFPNLQAAERATWTKHQITVKRDIQAIDGSIEALGVLATGSGDRATDLAFDDPVDFRNSIYQPNLRKMVKRAYTATWLGLLVKGGRVTYICNAWHHDDLTHDLKNKPQYHYKILNHAITEDFEAIEEWEGSKKPNQPKRIPLWKAEWPKSRLLETFDERRSLDFNRAFRHLAMEHQMFPFTKGLKESEIKMDEDAELADLEVPADFPRFTGVDLGTAKKKRSQTTLFTLAIDPDTLTRWPIDIRAGYWSGPDSARQIIEVNKEHQPFLFFVENNAYQSTLQEWIEEIEGGLDIPIMGYYTGSQVLDLEIGLPGIALQMEKKLWKIPKLDHGPTCQCSICQWREELANHPIGTKDIIMAMWLADRAAKRSIQEPSIRFVGESEEDEEDLALSELF